MYSKRILVIAFTAAFSLGQLSAFANENSRSHASREMSWFDRTFNWALTNAMSLVAGSGFGAITTLIVAWKLRANGLPVENARFVAQVIQAAQSGYTVSLEPLSHLVNTIRAAHEAGIPINDDGTFAVDWWRLDERTKRMFVAALRRLSGQGQ